ncbi:hypothetical protein N7492_003376 [Penicillium capsulatum]|uniref:Uncharacterized protein n=1 Tax=Penicillium capsulatum TaxID=69766 RepID=A0A9W9IQV7_9EURO|nr:hypothetical protein N7492_003376 [Penicillium capsulatum]
MAVEEIEVHVIPRSEANDPEKNTNTKLRPKSWTFKVWRLIVASGALAATVVLTINIITLVVVCAKYP